MMNRYSFVVGGTSDRGPEALILDGCQVIGVTSLAVAGKIVAALNLPIQYFAPVAILDTMPELAGLSNLSLQVIADYQAGMENVTPREAALVRDLLPIKFREALRRG